MTDSARPQASFEVSLCRRILDIFRKLGADTCLINAGREVIVFRKGNEIVNEVDITEENTATAILHLKLMAGMNILEDEMSHRGRIRLTGFADLYLENRSKDGVEELEISTLPFSG